MLTRPKGFAAGMAAASLLALTLAGCGGEDNPAGGSPVISFSPTPTSTPTPTPTAVVTGTPTAELVAALAASLDDERKAEATYIAVIDKIGPAAPFPNILLAEQRHAEMVIQLYVTRGLDVPDNSWIGRGVAEDTLIANCLVGVTGEEENIAMYDRLLATLDPQDEDVRLVFLALQQASRDNHLPAFKQCAGVL